MSFQSSAACRLLQWVILLCISLPGSAQALADDATALTVFVREGCPHCAAAESWLPVLARQRPDLEIEVRHVDRDSRAREDLERLSRMAGIWPPGVPAFLVQGRLLIGFATPETSGPDIMALIDNRERASGGIELPLIGETDPTALGLPLFTLAVGLVDGFNPCAMWVLLFLLSLLVHLKDRKRIALIAGTFVAVSGAVYYLFMAAWLNLFQWVGLSELLRWGLGCLALLIGAVNMGEFFRHGGHFLLSIPDSAKPGLYARARAVVNAQGLLSGLLGIAVLAVVVNAVELLCTAGLPALYTAILTQQELTPLAYYAYLGLYIVGYIADDALMVTLAVTALSSRKLTAQSGRWLKLVSGLVMALLGVVMLVRPGWLM